MKQANWHKLFVKLVMVAALCISFGRRSAASTGQRANLNIVGEAIHGAEIFDSMFTETFEIHLGQAIRHLNATADAMPTNISDIVTMAENKTADFVFCSPSLFSCLADSYDMAAIATLVTESKGVYLDRFGAAIVSRADNPYIQTVWDIVGRRVSLVELGSLGGAQMQWMSLREYGIDIMTDTEMVLIAHTDEQVLLDVYEGRADVGFVRSDALRVLHRYGHVRHIQEDDLRVLDPRVEYVHGEVYPYRTSTELQPEWVLAAAPHVDALLVQAVSKALLAITEDSTAAQQGQYAFWRPPMSYLEVYQIERELTADALHADDEGMDCHSRSDIYESVKCPDEHIKLNRADFEVACADQCPAGSDCVCKPCRPGEPVEMTPFVPELHLHGKSSKKLLHPTSYDYNIKHREEDGDMERCQRMHQCVAIEQREVVTFELVDHLHEERMLASGRRPDHLADAHVILHDWEGDDYTEVLIIINMTSVEPGVYEANVTSKHTGSHLIEVVVEGVQADCSPFLMLVVDRTCHEQKHTSDSEGQCVCASTTFDVGGYCFSYGELAATVCAPGFVLLVILAVYYGRWQQRKADALWTIKAESLQFEDNPEVLGSGSFGLVLKAKYRGTWVAVKRALPRQRYGDKKKKKEDTSLLGSQFSRVRANTMTTATSQTTGAVGMGSIAATLNSMMTKSGAFRMRDLLASVMKKHEIRVAGSKSSKSRSRARSVATATLGIASRVARAFGGTHWATIRREQRLRKLFIEEMRTLSKLRHPCIATVMGAVLGTQPALVMEFMEHGSLHQLLKNDTIELDTDILIPIVRDVSAGMAFLHDSDTPLIHGDIKAANVLVDANFRGKIADFGLAQQKQLTGVGTPAFMAPELLRGESLSTRSDVYAFGIMISEVFARQDPYSDRDDDLKAVLMHVADISREIPYRPSMPKDVPEVMDKMARHCWHVFPQARPSFSAIHDKLQNLNVHALGTAMLNSRRDHQDHERVLHDVFPPHIAQALKEGRKVEPESRDCVTIFFSDIVGFTDISSNLDPALVSDMLDRLYTQLDELSHEHDVFKVETIGDAFMAVCNLHKDQADHAARIGRFAIDAIDAALRTPVVVGREDELGFVNIRVGFHSGPVVANVVGTRNPRYCLFGDTVNTASRMESNGVARRIHLSRAAAKLVRLHDASLRLDGRGKIPIKGKGTMFTYWLLHKNDPVQSSDLDVPQSNAELGLESPGASNRGVVRFDEATKGGQDAASEAGLDEDDLLMDPNKAPLAAERRRRSQAKDLGSCSSSRRSSIVETVSALAKKVIGRGRASVELHHDVEACAGRKSATKALASVHDQSAVMPGSTSIADASLPDRTKPSGQASSPTSILKMPSQHAII